MLRRAHLEPAEPRALRGHPFLQNCLSVCALWFLFDNAGLPMNFAFTYYCLVNIALPNIVFDVVMNLVSFLFAGLLGAALPFLLRSSHKWRYAAVLSFYLGDLHLQRSMWIYRWLGIAPRPPRAGWLLSPEDIGVATGICLIAIVGFFIGNRACQVDEL